MLSRILQSINTNVRELGGRQPSSVSPISAEAFNSDENDYDNPGDPLVQEYKTQETLAEKTDDRSHPAVLSQGDLSTPYKEPDLALYSPNAFSEDKGVEDTQLTLRHNEKEADQQSILCLKKHSAHDPSPRSSITLSSAIHLAKQISANSNDDVRRVNAKRKMVNQQLPGTRKMHRKVVDTRRIAKVSSSGHDYVKSPSKSGTKWCRRCGVIETCRWRTSPAGSQTACNACYLMVKGKRLPDTEFEKFLSCPSEISAMDKKDATHMKKPQNIVYNTLKTSAASKKYIEATDRKQDLTALGTEMLCANIHCRAKSTLVWRRGPEGKKCLCNRCGLRWAHGRLPNDKIIPVAVIPDKATASSRVKEMTNSCLSQVQGMGAQIQRTKKIHDNTLLLKNGQRLASDRKNFLDAGLYSNEHKSHFPPRSSKTTNIRKNFVFKLPEYYGEYLMTKEADFRLSYDIMEAFQNNLIGKEAEENKQSSPKPNPFVKIRSNVFVERKHTRHNRKSPICQCKAPVDGSPGCNEDCLNRMMFYECDVQTCPCGKFCSNQRFQQKEEIDDLKVFWTNGRGWGLKTLTDIKVGQLIVEYRGEVISQRLCEERLRTVYKDTKNFYFLDYQKGEVIDAAAKGSDARFVNHSCEPNCHIEKWAIGGEVCVGVFATQDIPADSELFYDYNYTLIGSGVSQKCRCGSTKCRGYMGRKGSGKIMFPNDEVTHAE